LGIRSLKIRHLIFGMIILLAGISFLFIIWKTFDIRDDLTEAEQTSSANLLSDNIMRANILLGSEQSLTLIMLLQPEMATRHNLDQLHQLRIQEDSYITYALSLARELIFSDPHHPLYASLESLAEQDKKLRAARNGADHIFDRIIGNGKSDSNEFIVEKSWNEAINDYIEALATVRRDALIPYDDIDKVFLDNLVIKEILLQIFKYASQERTLIGDVIAQRRSFNDDELHELQRDRGSYQYHLDRLISTLESNQYYINDDDDDLINEEYLENYEELRQKILNASEEKKPYPVDVTQWLETATHGIDAFINVVDHINENTNQRISYANKQQRQKISVLATFTIIIVASIALTALIIRRRIFIPLGKLLAASDRIALGKFDLPIDIHGSDEFGELGKSFEQMRLSLLFDSRARKQAEESLKDTQKRTRGIVDAAADSIISVNDEGLIMSFNPASEKIFGYRAKEVMGRNINVLMKKTVADKHDKYIQQYLLTGKSNIVNAGTREISAVRKNGEVFALELAITEINFGVDNMFIVISRDITQRKEIKRALVKARDEAIEANQVKSEFLAGMSHELRTPLNAIIGFSEMLLKEIDGPINDEQKNSISYIEKSGKNLLTLINDILDMSKIEAGRMEVSPEPVNISKVIGESLESVGILFREKGLILRKEVAQDLPIVQADPARIRQVMLNLLSNAVKFTDEGEVIVRCHEIDSADPDLPNDISSELPPASQWIMVAVEDNGFGIAQANIPKVFEEFRQIEGGASRKRGGTGLGVPISKRFVEMHGGRMWLRSVEGYGTTFYFILPIVADELSSPASPSDQENNNDTTRPELDPVDRRKTRILIVDDDPAAVALCRKFLMESGCQVYSVALGSEVMNKVDTFRPDIILLDIMLPDKDGWQILEELKANPETDNIPVIICSVLDNRQLGLSLGASEFFVKPVNEHSLIIAIEKFKKEVKSILVIDDDVNAIELTRELLGKDVYRIYGAKNGQDGLELMRIENPDLVLLELHMPGMDGYEVLETIKRDPEYCDIPVIVMTAMELDPEKTARIRDKAEIVQKSHCSDQYFVNLITKTLEYEAREEA